MNLLALLALITGLALAPALLYVLLIWWLDRYEKEPISLAILAFVWGATPAILLALVFEILLGIPLGGAGPIAWRQMLLAIRTSRPRTIGPNENCGPWWWHERSASGRSRRTGPTHGKCS